MDIELARVVLRQGELKLQAQMDIVNAVDARATAVAAIGITLALASASAVVVLRSIGAWDVLMLGMAATSLVLLAGAAVSAVSLWPAAFRTAGNLPHNWWADNVEDRPLAECLRKESDNYQGRIESNRVRINRKAALFRVSLALMLLSPLPLFVALGVRALLA